jgi:hypothetical protein
MKVLCLTDAFLGQKITKHSGAKFSFLFRVSEAGQNIKEHRRTYSTISASCHYIIEYILIKMYILRIISVILLIACSVILRNCSGDENQMRIISSTFNFETLSFVHSMKGWELYSWQQGSQWQYSILSCTDRLKH